MKNIQDELELLKSVMHAIAAHFGENCEVVLHDWSKGYEHTIVAIENGRVTGRKVGDCGSNLGLEVLRGTVQNGDRFNYITQTQSGKTIRSTSIYLKDDEQKPIGALCINLDISDVVYVKKVVDEMAMVSSAEKEIFVNDVGEILDFLLKESLNLVGKPVEHMVKEDKLAALQFLDEKGAFLISKAGGRICQFFDISKFTLYNYLDEIRSRREQPSEGSK